MFSGLTGSVAQTVRFGQALAFRKFSFVVMVVKKMNFRIR